MRYATHCVTLMLLLSIPGVTCAQYTESDILEIELQAREHIEQGEYQKGYDLYPDITHAIRVNEGLYSPRQMDYLLGLIDWHQANDDFETATDIQAQARWLLSRQPDIKPDIVAALILKLVAMPQDLKCFAKSDNMYRNGLKRCILQRMAVADAHIYALELQQQLYALTKSRKDRILVGLIAGKTAWLVRGLFPETILEISPDGYRSRTNYDMNPKYNYETYLEIQGEADYVGK